MRRKSNLEELVQSKKGLGTVVMVAAKRKVSVTTKIFPSWQWNIKLGRIWWADFYSASIVNTAVWILMYKMQQEDKLFLCAWEENQTWKNWCSPRRDWWKDFLFRVCCRHRSLDLMYKMQQDDKLFLCVSWQWNNLVNRGIWWTDSELVQSKKGQEDKLFLCAREENQTGKYLIQPSQKQRWNFGNSWIHHQCLGDFVVVIVSWSGCQICLWRYWGLWEIS